MFSLLLKEFIFDFFFQKAPAGPEFTFYLTFDKCSTNNRSIQYVDYADKPKHNSSDWSNDIAQL